MKQKFAIAILLFVAFLVIVYLILPKYSQANRLQGEISNKENVLEKRKDYFSELKKTATDLENYQGALDKINSALPKEPLLPTLLHYLQVKASENGLLLESIGQAAGPSPAGAGREGEEPTVKQEIRTKESFVQLGLVGSVFAMENFLYNVEKSSRLIEVETISLQTEKEELPAFNLLIKVYSY